MSTEVKEQRKPMVYKLYDSPMKPEEIEEKSFETIDAEAGTHRFSQREWIIVRRMIHTTADFSLMDDVEFSPDALDAGVNALLNGRPIYVDSNMIRSGISPARLKTACHSYSRDDVVCHVADEDVARDAKKAGLPRSLFGVRKAGRKKILDGGIAVFGNAPVAVLELNRMIAEENIKPALVIAMPVGFVHVTECKDELVSLDVPFIALRGRRGGSTIAVSVVHSLCSLTKERAVRQ
ncbi:MAG: cobalt-precorrin-8 methylmutase [bacterium]|nr:MAG: cobalt-precorrin-8 methylmutase [bacterium]